MTVHTAPKTKLNQPCIALANVKDGEVFTLAALTAAANAAANPPEGVSYENGITVTPVEPTPAANA